MFNYIYTGMMKWHPPLSWTICPIDGCITHLTHMESMGTPCMMWLEKWLKFSERAGSILHSVQPTIRSVLCLYNGCPPSLHWLGTHSKYSKLSCCSEPSLILENEAILGPAVITHSVSPTLCEVFYGQSYYGCTLYRHMSICEIYMSPTLNGSLVVTVFQML